MKAVMLSIRPKWCNKIASGEKVIEIRKNRPRLETPFKCYIYCIKPKFDYEDYIAINIGTEKARDFFGGGMIIGDFICDYIAQFESEFYDDDSVLNAVYSPDLQENVLYKIWGNDDVDLPKFAKQIAMTLDELKKYIGTDKPCKEFYGWHISKLVIYDKPKELSDFYCRKLLTRPPQSWCYVEEVNK